MLRQGNGARAQMLRDAIDAEADQRRSTLPAVAGGDAPRAPCRYGHRRGLDARHLSRLSLSAEFPPDGAWLYPNAYGTLGYALPAAIGARVAQPERPAAVLIGDGGFLFTCPELLTATERGIGLPVVVWNDQGYGCIREGMLRPRRDATRRRFRDPGYFRTGTRRSAARTPNPMAGADRGARRRSTDVPTVIEIAHMEQHAPTRCHAEVDAPRISDS